MACRCTENRILGQQERPGDREHHRLGFFCYGNDMVSFVKLCYGWKVLFGYFGYQTPPVPASGHCVLSKLRGGEREGSKSNHWRKVKAKKSVRKCFFFKLSECVNLVSFKKWGNSSVVSQITQKIKMIIIIMILLMIWRGKSKENNDKKRIDLLYLSRPKAVELCRTLGWNTTGGQSDVQGPLSSFASRTRRWGCLQYRWQLLSQAF